MKGRKLLSAIIAGAMVLGTMSFPAFAEGDVASIGDTTYTTLAAAVEAAKANDTIKLVDDTTESGKVTITGKTITIDFDGHTLNGSILINGNSVVTVEDGYIRQTELVSGIEIAENANVTINNMDVESFRHAIRVDADNAGCVATAVINGGKYLSTNNTTTCHGINIGSPNGKSVVTIYDGEFYGPVGNANGGNSLMIQNHNDDVKIYGGYFAEASGIEGCICPANGLKIYGTNSPKFGTWSYDSYVQDDGLVVEEDDVYIVRVPVAEVNENRFASLQAAVTAANSGDTVKLLSDASGDGVIVPSGSNIAIDLGGYTYNIDGTTVGSAGTETNGFQLLRDSNITIKNGTITSDKAKILIQNYSNLTLENVTLDGSNLPGTNRYVLSNNCGDTALKGNTNIIAKDGDFAFDCYYWPSNGYTEGVTVTLGTDFTGKITGNIKMSDDGTDTANAASKQSISISGGTFTTDVNEYCADGYASKENADGTYSVGEANYVAQIGAAKYTSLADAIASLEGASGDVTIKLLSDANFSFGARAQIGNENTTSITIDGGNNVLDLLGTDTDWSSLGNAGGKLVFKNVTINKTEGGNGAWNNHAFNITSYVEFDNVTVNNAVTIHDGGKFTQTNFYEAGEYYTLYIPAVDQDVVIENCNFEATNGGRGIKVIEQYVSEAEKAPVDITVTGSTFKTAKKAAILVTSTEGANIIASGNDITEVAADSINLVWVDEDLPASYSKVNVTIDEKAVAPYLEGIGIVVAQIGNAYYTSLADAVAAAANGDTVKLLTNASGNGVAIMAAEAKNITIDLGGYTYIVSSGAVGSTNYETQGFHLEKGSKITIKNGTITSTADSGVLMLVQNYCNLTLENVTLDGSNLPGTNRYVLSNNCGNTALKGNTNIIAKDGDFAFDCYYWPSNGYTEGVTVTLGTDFTGKITGNIKMSDDGTDTANAASKQSISISGGTFTTDVSAFLADGYKLTTNEDGTFGVVPGEEETEPEILKKSLCVKYSQLGNYNGKNTIKLSLFAGVDTLNYSEVGFDVTLNGVTKTFPVKVVYDSVTVKMGDEIKTIPASDFGKGVNHIFGYTINFPATAEFKNAKGTWTPYAIRNKEKITGNTFILNNMFSGELGVSE